jgi:hypothetical protein
MDIEALLDAHARQHPDLRAVIARIRVMRAKTAEVEAEQYQPTRAAALVAEIRSATAQAIADELRGMLADAARADATAMDRRDRDERERVAGANGHAIDPHRITMATTAAEISVLLHDAAALDADSVRKAWGYAQPVLKQMAAREAREHRQPHASSAFNTWTLWQSKMADLTRRAPDRESLAASASRRQRDLKERVLAVCRVVALDGEVAKLLLAAGIQERTPEAVPAKNSLTSGSWWDRFNQK